MTREQLDLLLRYINAKVRLADPALRGTQQADRLMFDLSDIVRQLEESTTP